MVSENFGKNFLTFLGLGTNVVKVSSVNSELLFQWDTLYMPLATFAYNMFNTPNLANYSPYELVFGRKPKLLLNLETVPDIKVSVTFKDYYSLLNKRLQYLHKLLQDFKSKRLAMINKDRTFFQYNSGDLVYLISPPTSQLYTASGKVMIKKCRSRSNIQNYRPT